MGRAAISACIICFNEEGNIQRCLDSVKWADEIVVVDSFSTDKTVHICRAYTDRVYVRYWDGYVDQKNYCLNLASNRWVLSIDADEELSPGLAEEIKREFADGEPPYDGFYFPRRTRFLGRWIDHCGWYPDHKLRLFKKDVGRFGGHEIHDRVLLKGETKRMENPLLHYTYNNISQQLRSIDNYSTLWAEDMSHRGKRGSYFRMILRPAVKFFETYIYKKGFLDGFPGLVISAGYAYQIFLRYAKLKEMELQKGKGSEG